MMLNLTSKSINLTIPTINEQTKSFMVGLVGCKPISLKFQLFVNADK
jgi:hypothetical protein